MLRLKPEDFRAMSPVEFLLALEGYKISKGYKDNTMTWNEVLEIEAAIGVPHTSKSIKKHGKDNR